jgi:hypothetical protein
VVRFSTLRAWISFSFSATSNNSTTKKMANSKEKIAEFVRNNLLGKPDPDGIPRMHRMLNVDRSITNINIKDSFWNDWTALHYQAEYGTTGSVAWLLKQDPPPDVDELDNTQFTPLTRAAWSDEDPEGKVRLLLDHGADRNIKNEGGSTALDMARFYNKPAAVIDMLENYRPDVSR